MSTGGISAVPGAPQGGTPPVAGLPSAPTMPVGQNPTSPIQNPNAGPFPQTAAGMMGGMGGPAGGMQPFSQQQSGRGFRFGPNSVWKGEGPSPIQQQQPPNAPLNFQGMMDLQQQMQQRIQQRQPQQPQQGAAGGKGGMPGAQQNPMQPRQNPMQQQGIASLLKPSQSSTNSLQ